MLRANVILLVLMGGGLALWSSRPSAECRDARARNMPNAASICAPHSSGSYWGHGYWGGRTSSNGGTTSAIASVVRGGFGGFHGFSGS